MQNIVHTLTLRLNVMPDETEVDVGGADCVETESELLLPGAWRDKDNKTHLLYLDNI